jgi:hypothetical protein
MASLFTTIATFLNLKLSPYRFSDQCTFKGADLKVLSGQPIKSFDVISAYDDSKKELGKGAFGIVKQIDWGSPEYPQVAVKKVTISEDDAVCIARELEFLHKMSPANISTALIACVQTDHDLYLVQSLILGKLKNSLEVRPLLEFQTKIENPINKLRNPFNYHLDFPFDSGNPKGTFGNPDGRELPMVFIKSLEDKDTQLAIKKNASE